MAQRFGMDLEGLRVGIHGIVSEGLTVITDGIGDILDSYFRFAGQSSVRLPEVVSTWKLTASRLVITVLTVVYGMRVPYTRGLRLRKVYALAGGRMRLHLNGLAATLHFFFSSIPHLSILFTRSPTR